jgi:hypothetical protein
VTNIVLEENGFYTLKIEAAVSSEKLVDTYQSTGRSVLGSRNPKAQ